MIHVLHVIAGLQKAAGTSVFCIELCDKLQVMGVECCIAIPEANDNDVVSHAGVCIIKGDWRFCNIPFKPDIVHIHAIWDLFLHRAVLWAKSQNVPIVFSPHGMLTPWSLRQKKFKKRLALVAYQYKDLRAAALFHATAESELDDIRRLGLEQPVVIAPLGVKVPSVSPRIRHNHPRIALFVSRVHPKKGLFSLVDAWASLKNSVNGKPLAVTGKTENRSATVDNSPLTVNGIPWRCLIAGPDQDGHAVAVMERARAAGVGHDFEMVGPIFGKQKDDLYAKADLFVLPTYSENFGVVVIEALAQGCPVITTKGTPWSELLGDQACLAEWKNSGEAEWQSSCGLAREESPAQSAKPANLATPATLAIAGNGRCGWWIDIGVEPLAEALKEAMGLSDDERRAMGENGRRLVAAKYTWSAIAEQMKAAYEWIADGGEPPESVSIG